MTGSMILLTAVLIAALVLACEVLEELFFRPLGRVPGPKIYAFIKWRLVYDDYLGETTRQIQRLHDEYGSVVRIGPRNVSLTSLSALHIIYSASRASTKPAFYRIFEPYGRPTMFTMASATDHRDRKKLIAPCYAKSTFLHSDIAAILKSKIDHFMSMLAKDTPGINLAHLLRFFTLDATTAFIFGREQGTGALLGEADRALLDDLDHPHRRILSWLSVHAAALSNSKVAMQVLGTVMPALRRQAPFTSVRAFAREAANRCLSSLRQCETAGETSLFAQLMSSRDGKQPGLEDIDVASECADHLLAGILTTSDALTFLVWELSRPEHRRYQERLRHELAQLDLSDSPETHFERLGSLPFLNAVLKESLRLHAPLPSSQPRVLDADVTIDGFRIPAGTIVSISPHSLHYNADIFQHPTIFDPDRWLREPTAEMEKSWWPFSSGARMCTGIHLAMAEMTALVAALYTAYSTSIQEDFVDISPAITSRFEVFWADGFDNYSETTYGVTLSKL